MTETTERRGNGGGVETGENQRQVFTCSHTPLGIRQTTPDSHIPTAPATVAITQTKKTKTRKEVGRCAASAFGLFSGSRCIGNASRFRIIRRLENAPHTFVQTQAVGTR